MKASRSLNVIHMDLSLAEAYESSVLAVREIPGVRYQELQGSQGVTRLLTIPSTAWMLAPVHTLLESIECEHLMSDRPSATLPALDERFTAFSKLREYQIDGVDFLWNHDGGMLAMEMGLGKTMVAGCYGLLVDGPKVIIAPKYLRTTWRTELEKWGILARPEDFCALVSRDLDHKCWSWDAQWYFVHYDIVDVWWTRLTLRRPQLVIVDEAHMLKNWRTTRAKRAKLVTAPVKRRVLLTGTPAPNRPGELWNLLDTLTGQWTWGTPTDFRVRYAGAFNNGYGYEDTGPTHTDELRSRMAACTFALEAKDVVKDLPPLQRIPVYVPFDTADARDYATLLNDLDMRAVLDALIEGRAGPDTLKSIAALRKIVSEAKVEATLGEIAAVLDQGASCVVFCWQRSTAAKIADKVKGLLVHGDKPQSERDSIVRAFNGSTGPLVLVATYGALGVGANLEKASVVILHDLDWVPGNVLQAEARIYRPASDLTRGRVTISKWMLAEQSLDVLFARILVHKSQEIDAVTGSENASKLDVLSTLAAEADPQDMAASIADYWRRWAPDE